MLINKYLEQNNLKINYNLDYIADGADGTVFKIDDRRVLKLSVIFDYNDNLLKDFRNVNNTINELIHFGDSNFAKVYEYKYLGTFSRTLDTDKQNYVLYYYIMEMLNPLSEDEKKVFHTILSHEDKNIVKNYSDKEINDMLHMLSYGLDFDTNGVKLLCDGLKKSKIKHTDIHSRNIMKNNDGKYLMVDFDRCFLREKV